MKEKFCDVLVVGGGGSGMVAAARAAEAGCSVIVLEKSGTLGGGMLFASTMRTFRSKWQAERNIPDQANAFMRKGMDATLWRLDPAVVRTAILGTGKFFDWYSEHEKPEVLARYEPRPYVFDIPVNGQVGPQIDGFHQGSGRMIIETMKRYCQELGVELLTRSPARDIQVENGRLLAVLADSPEGELRIVPKTCILASGSWIRRKDITEKVLPAYLDIDVLPSAHDNPAYTGEAIDFGEKLGALIDWDSFCFRIMGPVCALGDHSDLDVLCHINSTIIVDLDAKRFAAEPLAPRMDPFDTGHVLLKHPRGRTFTLFSRNLLEQAIAESRDPNRERSYNIFDVEALPDLEVIDSWFQKELDRRPGVLGKADTVRELAEQVGLDPEQLEKTVAEYNQSCAQGEDWQFCKDPRYLVPLSEGPFYALPGRMMTDGAFGGVKVNERMQALAAEGGVIEGVFVTGDVASGRHISLGGVKKQVINDMSWALASGFVAGSCAAQDAGK